AGLPDEAFANDGQLTKREVRAATLAVLAPLPGELLWDVGAGCGSIAVEWLRVHDACRAVAIERDEKRLGFIRENADALGVPWLEAVGGVAPAALDGLDPPHAVFVGGGVTTDGLLDACWAALRPGGRLVANVVSVEGEHALYHWHAAHGGELRRIAVQHATPVGRFMSWRPKMPVTQYVGVKP
ncbi:MAG: precorrin-6Y C5,15-methyltransferase (decarboxylating) subunit CbiT, partial [Alphaproteobacteria bacterium]|nr:precorrin-6Y C5,15-methyltransferase (decarboxylating) subunit CbiT [Alphaproteobacteria bacterium]